MFFQESEKGLILRIRLTPKASSNKVEGEVVDEKGVGWLKIKVTSVPEHGKANQALLQLLSKTWKIPKTALRILQGETDRHKTLCIADPLVIQSFVQRYSLG